MSDFVETLPECVVYFLDVMRAHLPTAVLTAVVVAWLLAASIIDLRRHRLPNALTVGGLLLGLGLQFTLLGWNGLLDGLGGFAAGFFIYLPLYAFGWMGAGDVKLMGAAGSFVGWPASLLAVSLSTGLGALFALGLIAVRGGLSDYFSRYWQMLRCLLSTGQFAYVPPRPGEAATQRFPYAIAIALGTAATLWAVGSFDPFLQAFGLGGAA